MQEKIFEELDSVFGSSDRPANMNDMANLKYLECVFRESIRLFPPVPILSRLIEEDITIGKSLEVQPNTSKSTAKLTLK